jgi:uncharacterized CHY-type Zn-finger protein
MQSQSIYNREIYGLEVNKRTGCLHYPSDLDIIAIRFKCCELYYSCYLCHLAIADHCIRQWQYEDMHQKAILCGCCGYEMTIAQYFSSANKCLNCQSQFNPGCKSHWSIYFDNTCVEAQPAQVKKNG